MTSPDQSSTLSATEEKKLFWLTLIYIIALLAVLALVSWLIWGKDSIIMWVPVAILQWSFAGGMVAVLYRLAYRKEIRTVGLELYIWVIAKPIIGLFMGALVYFIALAGGKLLDASMEAIKDELWLNVIAFVGGFSDDLSVGLVKRFVDRRLGREIDKNDTVD